MNGNLNHSQPQLQFHILTPNNYNIINPNHNHNIINHYHNTINHNIINPLSFISLLKLILQHPTYPICSIWSAL